MTYKIFIGLLTLSLTSCSLLDFYGDDNMDEYRDGSTKSLINNGSLIGSWEETSYWRQGEHSYYWDYYYGSNINNYHFKENGIFTSTSPNECTENRGTYTISGSKLSLEYHCIDTPKLIEKDLIKEFFFRDEHIVFVRENDDIRKLEFIFEE